LGLGSVSAFSGRFLVNPLLVEIVVKRWEGVNGRVDLIAMGWVFLVN
jgi:hypothetical protein